ncbi:DUF3017 domain-containing protein [Streptomyces sp. NPDC014724]|uniref:DUF3017 domain-containing protein n=1 Tax=unclassified Streptomyces TaxID=2593676 RepID=UPI0036FEDFAD
MGAGTSPADPAAEADRKSRESAASKGAAREGAAARGPADADAGADVNASAGSAGGADSNSGPEPEPESGAGSRTGSGSTGPDRSEGVRPQAAPSKGERPSRRFPSFTRDTARPEGGGRAASGDAPAPARQWPLLAVLCTAGIGLLIVAVDPFAEAFRIGTILIGAALIGGAVLRLVVPSVGMLAVRSRFTDLVTYGLLGFLIVMLALVAQPKPWLDMPFLEDAVHFTIR